METATAQSGEGAGVSKELQDLYVRMGHKNIAHTVRYTELAPERFKEFWRD